MSTKPAFSIPETPADPDCTTQQYVYERLRHAIMIGAMEPGTALTLRGLADAMDLSPTPVREAVRRLSSENAIHIKQNRRLSIPGMTLARFEELMALRLDLELHAAQRALPYVSDIRVAQMQRINDDMDRAMLHRDLDCLTTLDHHFHRTLYQVNPNQVSVPLIESVWLQLGPFQRQILELLEVFRVNDRHQDILTALGARNVGALVRALKQDIRESTVKTGRKLLAAGSSPA